MPQSLSKVYVHIVFSTKNHSPFIKSNVENELFAYIGGVIRDNGGILMKINAVPDHIHILSTLPKNISQSKFLEEIKRNSSLWIKTKGKNYTKFAWQRGYGIFSVSSSGLNSISNYIQNQKKYHQKISFKEELICLLKEFGIDYDEKYLWD
jgi:putative transposase